MEPINEHKWYSVRAAKNPWGPGIDVLITYIDGGNVIPLKVEHPGAKAGPGVPLATSLVLRDTEAVALMTNLWDAGVRPAGMEEKKG